MAGCGTNALSDDDQLAYREARVTIARSMLDSTTVTPADRERAVDGVIMLYRDNPDVEIDGAPMRDELEDIASDVDDQDPDLAAKIDRAIAP